MYRNLKKLILFVLVIVLSLNIIPFSAVATETYDFANFTEEEGMAFLIDCNIDIPEEFILEDDLPSFTLGLILQAYHNPNQSFHFNYNVTQAYAEEIRLAVRSHMDLDAIPAIASETTYELQYNTVMNEDGEWVTSGGFYDPRWKNYNCYAYAINRAEYPCFTPYDLWPFIQYQPGAMSKAGTFGSTTTIDQLAVLVKNDLLAMGYDEVTISSTIPAIDDSQELICVRRASSYDYHFMHYDLDTNAWYHKPSYTAVLKYNYTPSNDLDWFLEYSYKGEEWIYVAESEYDWDRYYGEIRFITYSKNQINVGSETTLRKIIQAGKDIFCEFNFTNAKHYNLDLESNYEFYFAIYNEEFDIISSGNSVATYDEDLEKYIYIIDTRFDTLEGDCYLRINFNSSAVQDYVDISVEEADHLYDCVYLNNLLHL